MALARDGSGIRYRNGFDEVLEEEFVKVAPWLVLWGQFLCCLLFFFHCAGFRSYPVMEARAWHELREPIPALRA